MKKSAFLLGLLAITSLCLTACGNSKDYTMSFDEAYDTANHSALQDILINSENAQQSLNLSTNIDNWSNKMAIILQSNSKQSLWNKKSESSTTFDVNINADDTNVLVNWALDIRSIDNTIYLNQINAGEEIELRWVDELRQNFWRGECGAWDLHGGDVRRRGGYKVTSRCRKFQPPNSKFPTTDDVRTLRRNFNAQIGRLRRWRAGKIFSRGLSWNCCVDLRRNKVASRNKSRGVEWRRLSKFPVDEFNDEEIKSARVSSSG